jgi:hypothetical protein
MDGAGAMIVPIVLAQTPRAGRFNHLNLVPARVSLPARLRPNDVLGAAQTRPIGRDYIAAVREVRQGETARYGKEVLVLTGIRPPIDINLRTAVIQWLEGKLDELDVALGDMDWDNHHGGDRPCELLTLWGDEAARMFRLGSPPHSSRWNWLAPVIAGLVLLIGTYLYLLIRSKK